jgi:hypothetical protein
MSQPTPPPIRRDLTGLPAALAAALVLLVPFVGFTLVQPLSPVERAAALTTCTILAFATTLPGAISIADWLSRTLRQSGYLFALGVAFVPLLFASYALALRHLVIGDLLSVLLAALLPALLLWQVRHQRRPTTRDLVALSFLWVVVSLGLLPDLGLPSVGSRVAFVTLASIPLLLVVFAGRGWSGLGFSWHLSTRELGLCLLGALLGLALHAPERLAAFETLAAAGLFVALARASETYFFTALPQVLFDLGIGQRGVILALAAQPHLAPIIGIGVGALLAAGRTWYHTRTGWMPGIVAGIAAIGYGWVYWRTGKITAAAASQLFVEWM